MTKNVESGISLGPGLPSEDTVYVRMPRSYATELESFLDAEGFVHDRRGEMAAAETAMAAVAIVTASGTLLAGLAKVLEAFFARHAHDKLSVTIGKEVTTIEASGRSTTDVLALLQRVQEDNVERQAHWRRLRGEPTEGTAPEQV